MTIIHFHLPPDWIADPARMMPFYRTLFAGLDGRAEVRLIPMDRDGLADRVDRIPGIHILNHGQIRHPRALNCGIAYIYPFWNLDPWGIRAFSSIAETPFRPGRIDGDAARDVFRRLRARLVLRRQSRYEQPAEVTPLAPARAAVFLQSEGHRVVGETLYLDRWTMLTGVLEAVDGPVLVKPHPRDLDPETGRMLARLQRSHPHLQVTTANIHDILAVADRVVTINSAVGVEAYLHRKPVILCGRADFHHIADVAQTPEALRDFLQGDVKPRPYAKFIQWYFGENCLNAAAPDLVDRFLARLPQAPSGV